MRVIATFVFLICIAALPGLAQFDSSVVLGTVRDPGGDAVVDAAVKLTNVETGAVSEAKTSESGDYLFLNVKIGTYTVSATKPGFSTESAENVAVRVNARQRVDFDFRVGQVSETVQVTEGVIAVESDSSDRGLIVVQRQVVDLPLNGRNYSDLALLSTGVRRSDYAFANPPREGAFNVNGQRSVFNNFLLDGVDNNAYGTSNQGFSNQVVQLAPDAVGEFKIVTTNPGAEYGRSPGAVINANTKSGTNAIHGSAWEYLRNTSLNAVGFFKPPTGKPVLQRNQFGLTVGGPIVRDKAFFFADWEGFRERQKTVATNNLPTAAQRQGIFPTAITNPLTGAAYPANTPLPAGAITPFAAKVLADLPLPNPQGADSANLYRSLRADKNNLDKMDLKLDGLINARMSVFGRLSHRKSNYLQGPTIPGPSGGDGNGYIRALNQQLVLGWTWTTSTNSLLEVRYGQSKTRAGKDPPALGGPSLLDQFGIPGLPNDPRISGGLTTQAVTGFAAFGRQATNPQWQYPSVYNPKVNYTHILGRHALKAGYEYQRVHTEVQDVNPLYGNDIYAGGTGFSGQPLADFMFGLRSEYQLTTFFIANYRQGMHFAYLQDDWKITSKLTLNLGLRYEYATPMWERDNRLSNFDPITNRMLLAKDGSVSDRALVKPDRNNVGPRVGLAYSFDSKTVLRAAYGIGYVHFNRAGGGNLLAINGPQVVAAVVQQNPTTSPGTFRPTQAGYPTGITDPSNFNPLASTVTYMPQDTPTPMVQSWSFSIQRDLGKGFIADVGYVGNNSSHLIVFADFNQAAMQLPGQNLSVLARRPNPSFSAITVPFPYGRSNYNALQARLERRFTNGLSVLNSFVWSKAIDTTGQALEAQAGSGGRSSPQSFYNLQAERAVSDFDQPFNNTTAVLWEVPVGKDRKYLKSLHPVANGIIGGWQLSLINTLQTGQPVNLAYNPGAAAQVSITNPDWRGGISYRPNVTGPVMTPDGNQDNWLNPFTVVVPTDVSQPFGNAGRNIARRPGLAQLDFSAQKSFPLPREGMNISFRMEAFNAFNRTNFGNPQINRSAGGFGQIRSTFPARQIQFALRLVF